MRLILAAFLIVSLVYFAVAQDLTNLSQQLQTQEQKISTTDSQIKQATATLEEQIEAEKQRILQATNKTLLVDAANAQLTATLNDQITMEKDQKASLQQALQFLSQSTSGVSVESSTLTAAQMTSMIETMDSALLKELQSSVAKSNAAYAQSKAIEQQIAINEARYVRLEALLKQLKEKLVAFKK